MDPESLRPMLATAAPLPTDDAGWAFEMKWDGVRAFVAIDAGRLRIFSRSGRDVTERYPELHGLVDALGAHDAILDGEIVVLDESGRPSFEALQRHDDPAALIAFDVLELDGKSLCDEPYTERRARLEALHLDGPRWQTPPALPGRGEAALGTAAELGLEGVVAKRLDGLYLPGRRSAAWRKVKLDRSQEVVVGGWLPGAGRLEGRLGSLLVGVHAGDVQGLCYAGRVGSGIDEAARTRLERLLAARRRATCPFASEPRVRGSTWVRPDLVVEVRFAEWTRGGLLRQPSYRGLRDDRAPAGVVRERLPGDP